MGHKLEVTGERLIEEQYRASMGGYVIYLMHAASYRFVEDYCRGKRVLDLGCGSGYGAAEVAGVASHVHAVDVSPEAVAYARDRYVQPNLSFGEIRAGEPLPFADREFDVVLSFQVIEHVEDDAGYLQEASRVLKDGGVLVLITPDRTCRLLPGQRPWNRWHLREYGMAQLQRLVSASFDIDQALRMGARSDVAAFELRRYRLLKWLSLPFTFPGAPEAWRQFGLNLMHRFARSEGSGGKPVEPGFGVECIAFEPDPAHPLNLVLVASPRRGNRAAGGDAG